MNLISILYILSGILAMSACVPQIIQLVRVKCSDEFELRTWIGWLMAQVVSILYFVSLGDLFAVLVAIGWGAFYVVMVYLIIHYRFVHKALATQQLTPQPVHIKIK